MVALRAFLKGLRYLSPKYCHLIFSPENSSLGPEMGCLLKQFLDETLLSMLLQFMILCTCGLIYLLKQTPRFHQNKN